MLQTKEILKQDSFYELLGDKLKTATIHEKTKDDIIWKISTNENLLKPMILLGGGKPVSLRA